MKKIKLFYTEPRLRPVTFDVGDVIRTGGFPGEDDPLYEEE